MKKKTVHMTSIILILTLILTSTVIAVEPQASSYIRSCTATATASGGGKITVSFSILCNDIMTTVGATKIEIKNSSGTTLKTFNSTDSGYSSMMGSNALRHSGSVVYQGSSGSTYYAIVYFKAENNYGSDVDSVATTLAKAS